MSIDVALSGLFDEIQSVMLSRHSKYGARNITDSPGGPLNGLRTRLHDKLARINHVVDDDADSDFSDDSFRDAWVDVVGYGLIGLLVLDGDWPGTDKPVDLPSLIDRFDAAVGDPVVEWSPSLGRYAPRPAIDQDAVDAWWYGLPYKTKWSELHHGGDEESARHDNWRVGTTFQPADVWASLTWTRGADGWSAAYDESSGATLKQPNLPSVVRRNGYTDGTIIEPRQNTRDEAA